MSLWDRFKALIDKDSKELAVARIDPARVEKHPPATEARGDEHYFRLTLVQMFLRKERKFLQDFYPAVHSYVQCQFAGNVVEVPNVADASRLLANQDGSGNVVARNFTLVPLVPFKGGEVKVVAGLFAVPGKNMLTDFLGAMSGFAQLLAVPQLSSALSIATPLATGVQTLFAGQGGMYLGFHDTFVGGGAAGNVLTQSHTAVIRAPADAVDVSRLYVADQRLCTSTGPNADEHEIYDSHDFMLLRLEVREDRDDWRQLTSITQPFHEAVDALAEGQEEQAETHFRRAIVAAIKAPELTRVDRRRVVDLLNKDFAEAKSDLGFSNLLDDAGGYDLQSRMDAAAMGVDEAKALGEPTLDELVIA